MTDAVDAIAVAIRIASESTAANAIEYLADWANGHDAVEAEDVPHYVRWVERGRP